jgi:Tfp pilus assembly protein PilZ
MRLLTVPFLSSAEFLSHFSSKHPDGALFCRTRTELEVGEAILLEISFPGLPNRSLVRAEVLSLESGKGAWLTFHPDDSTTRDFLVGLARGELEVTAKQGRSHDRFPVRMPVAVRVTDGEGGSGEHTIVSEAHTEDVSASGLFIRSDRAPAVGTVVQLSLESADGGRFTLDGEVSWVNPDGFGVHFRDKRREDNRRLRTLLRRASESGRIRFAALPN